MPTLHASQALLAAGWARDVRVEIAADGRIGAVTPGVARGPGDRALATLLPAPANAHGHAFQRAMAGRTEARGPVGDGGGTQGAGATATDTRPE